MFAPRTWLLILALGGAMAAAGWRYFRPPQLRIAKAVAPKAPLSSEKPARAATGPASKAAAPKAAPPALPPQPDPRQFGYRGELFARLDKNANRYLEAAELPPRLRERFRKGDANKDGLWSYPEFDQGLSSSPPASALANARRSPLVTKPEGGGRVPVYVSANQANSKAADWFSRMDKDSDGQIGIYEWPAGKLAEFRKLDRNGDGFITADEGQSHLPPSRTAKTH